MNNNGIEKIIIYKKKLCEIEAKIDYLMSEKNKIECEINKLKKIINK